ncbi:MAG: thiamine-phosphate kinase [Ahniella sp.]|nr:thiamine-phosphate kinase [Ahniella sp.]
MHEFELIEWIRTHAVLGRGDVILGIGDDAAILDVPTGHELLVSTDTLVAGVHFPIGTAAADIGWKSLAVNLSDLAAMAATPAWVSLALTLPAIDEPWLRGFFEGFHALARTHQVSLIGGDCTRGPLSITVTIHGFAPRGAAIRRSGARPGDSLVLFGEVGLAAAGLRVQMARPEHERAGLPDDAVTAPWVQALNRPVPLNHLAPILRGKVNALIDVSDGLIADLNHILRASSVGARVALETLPALNELSAVHGLAAAQSMLLSGGDDYALLAAVPVEQVEHVLSEARAAGVAAQVVGSFEAEPGVRVFCAGQTLVLPERQGFNHFP